MPGIVLECSQHGDFDSFDVIRSLTSMVGIADSDLPSPIVTGLLTMYYVDTSIVEGTKYYYKFRVWRDGISSVSDEVSIIALAYDPNVLLNFDFSQSINNLGAYSNLPVEVVGSVALHQDGFLYVQNGGYLKLITSSFPNFNIGTKNYEFGIEIAMMSTSQGTYPSTFGVGNTWASGALSMQFNPSKTFMAAYNVGSEIDAFAPQAQLWDSVTFVKYVVRRIGGTTTTYYDGVPGTPLNTMPLYVDLTRNGVASIGAAIWNPSFTSAHSKIKNLYFKILE